ncbi:MAG TPA: aspartyl/asparaginyl beta-hydroxylase domain-containing protein [Solirubrobacteraceae bacterium]|nr:aspartyl/asparaginyl beta-hydroxylase domain-containing protein [Solirubrobacteraceae bacterium]
MADRGAVRTRQPQTLDPADSIIEFLRSEGAGELPHGRSRPLLDHLIGTYEILHRWGQPEWLQRAGLLHSVYGTDAYDRELLSAGRRAEVAGLAGEQAERTAFLFCVTPRGPLLSGTYRWARGLPVKTRDAEASRAELDTLVLLHMANLAEQAQSADGSPGRWLVRLRQLAELLIDSDAVELPAFVAQLAGFSDADESATRRAYAAGLARSDDPEWRASRLALAAAICPAVAEPCVWLAQLARGQGDEGAARRWAATADQRLQNLGTAWDKRHTFKEWAELAARGDDGVVVRGGPDPAAGRGRFHRYVESLAEGGESTLGKVYPELDSQPWFDPDDFPLARYLEANYAAIRAEVLALEPAEFHRESERIERSGDWDVAFLYERGRRRDELCDACPVTTQGIEAFSAMRTLTGLAYVSRMRAATHIQAHRGPTNLRVRCHLGIQVPDGDCAIRVGPQTRRWQDGRCLVFDDYFEHEAWNHTEQDRIVLIVDLWHPGLSATEVSLLEGLHAYASGQAGRLERYWAANRAAAGAATAARA